MRPLPSASMRRLRTCLGPGLLTIATISLAGTASGADPDRAVDKIKTASPIKHVIIIVGENRSFDHVFATYKPKTKDETVANLLSRKIVNADGSPGPNFARGHQFRIIAPPNGDKYFISASVPTLTLGSRL